MRRILLVEDDPNIAKSLIFNFEQVGLEHIWSQNIKQAQAAIEENQFDLYLFDIGLPDGTGIDLCRDFRDKGFDGPIILITAKVDEDSLVAGFKAGATDYVKKPFSNRELMARITANLNRLPSRTNQIEHKRLFLSIDDHQMTYQGVPFKMNHKQFKILFYLLSNVNRVVTRDALLIYLGNEKTIFDRTIDVHVSQIRKRLVEIGANDIQISSIYGIGYTIEA